MNDSHGDDQDVKWSGLDRCQEDIVAWQRTNFEHCEEWELVLGLAEEVGELAQCILKMKRNMLPERFNEARLQDCIGDVTVFLLGICAGRGWQLSDILRHTAAQVLERKWH